MPRPRTLLLPAPDTPGHWEIWSSAPGREATWQGTSDDAAALLAEADGTLALPARWCRTLSFPAPTQEKQLLRRLAWAQLEKRGLAAGAMAEASFECRWHAHGTKGGLVSVDVLTPAGLAAAELPLTEALLPFPRVFALPERTLVVLEEHGKLLLCAGLGGELVHSQILPTTKKIDDSVAAELRVAALTLQETGTLEAVEAVELWGDFTEGEADLLAEALAVPVRARSRPAPDAAATARGLGRGLLPAAVRQRHARRMRRVWRLAAVAAALLLLGAWLWRWHHSLLAVEAEAARLEKAVSSTAGEKSALKAAQDRVKATQERWSALRMALDARRYPLGLLNGLTRCLPDGGIVLGRFEFKNAEVTAAGSARTATDAYLYLNTVAKDKELAVMTWSMPQPAIAADGSATFELKGQMR